MISATVKLKFQSISEFNELIQKLNPQIEIEISDTSESEEFKEKLLKLSNDSRAINANTETDTPRTYTPAEPYVAHKLQTIHKPQVCIMCEKEFVPHHNRVKWCPECKADKEADKSKKARKPHNKPG